MLRILQYVRCLLGGKDLNMVTFTQSPTVFAIGSTLALAFYFSTKHTFT